MNRSLANFLLRFPDGFSRRLRLFKWRILGVRIGRSCWIRAIEIPRNPHDIRIGDFCALDRGVILLSTGDGRAEPRIIIRKRVYINRFTMIDASEKIEIGNDCMIGPFVYITDHDHGMSPDQPIHAQPLVSKPTIIGNNVWIGAGAIILKGVTIGDHSVVGAGAVVTKNIPASTKVAGVPARAMGVKGAAGT